MEMTTNQQLVELLEIVKGWAIAGTELMSREMPILAADIVRCGKYYSVCSMLLSLFGVVGTCFIIRKAVKISKDKDRGKEDITCIIVFIFGIVLAVITFFTILYSTAQAKAWIAPHLYVVEQVSELVINTK